MAHIINPEAEKILDKEFKVLNKGFIRLVDYLGGDERIVQAARVSYGKGTKTVHKDKGLINYLMRNGHTSPFEQVILTFHVKLPIFVARQWIRHRTARLNEISGRYSVMEDDFYLPSEEVIRKQSKKNRQGREEEIPFEAQQRFVEKLQEDQDLVYQNYSEALKEDIARELARINLPLSLYTQWYWQIDLRNLFHFLHLRLDQHAQYEIRCYARIMSEMVRKVAPVAYQAFEEYVLYSKSFSRTQIDKLKERLKTKADVCDQAEELLRVLEED